MSSGQTTRTRHERATNASRKVRKSFFPSQIESPSAQPAPFDGVARPVPRSPTSSLR